MRAHAGEQAGLLVRDRFFRSHVADVGRPHVGNHAHVRLDLARQRLDLARMVHAQFEHAVARLARQAGQADRHTDMVVEARRAGGCRRLRREHGAQRILGAGLADRAGDARDPRLAARAPGVTEIDQRLHRVGDFHEIALRFGHIARDDRRRRAARQRIGHESMAVSVLAGHGKEQIALADGAAVEGDAASLERPRHRHRRQGARHFVGGPQRAHDASSRATCESSNGWVIPLIVWPVS